MNILFHGGKEVVITPSWVDSLGNSTTKPAGVKLVINDNAAKVIDNGDGTWTVAPSRPAAYGISAQFVVPATSTSQAPKAEITSSAQAVSVTVRA